jgi:hypothetical protein
LSKLTSASTAEIIYENLDEDADDIEYVWIPDYPIGSCFYGLEAYGLNREKAILIAIARGFDAEEICEFFDLSEEEFDEYFIRCLKETEPEEWEFGNAIFELPHISCLTSSDSAMGIFKVDEDTFIVAHWKISIGGPYWFSFKRVDRETALEIARDNFEEEEVQKLFE